MRRNRTVSNPCLAARAGQALRRNGTSAASGRRGAFLVVALICLVLATGLVGGVLLLAQSQHRQMTQHQFRLQAEWLAQSGLERAAARLRVDPGYAGEIWSLPAASLGGSDTGQVTIRANPVKDDDARRTILVEAVFPAGSPQPVKRTRQTTLVLFQES